MKILMVIGSMGGGGAERVMAWLANRLVASGDAVCLITQRDTTRDFYPLHPSVRRITFLHGRYLNSSKISDYINLWRWGHELRALACAMQADVVLSFIDKLNLSVLWAFAGTRFPVVVSERIDPRFSDMNPARYVVRPFLYRWLARRVVVQTESIAAYARNEWGVRSVVVIPNAVTIGGAAVEAETRPRCVLSVGRLARQKGHDVLLAAWAKVAPRFPEWRLKIVGEGPMRANLEEQVNRLGLTGSVSLPGLTNDVAGEYQRAPIFVLPSRFEGFSNALLEAMASGCAPIATDVAGASGELIQSGVNGVLVPGDDVDALAGELGRVMGDEVLRRRYSQSAVARASQYAPDRIFQLWRQLFVSAAGLRESITADGD